jgi:hypothetical protein
MKNYDVSTISVLLDLVGVFNSQKIVILRVRWF